VGYNRDQSIVVTYSYYGFVGLQLTEAAYRLTEHSAARRIVEVAELAHQRAMAHCERQSKSDFFQQRRYRGIRQ
jgi:hypothetical protein